MFPPANQDSPVTTGIYIDGVARPAEAGRTYELFNPARPDELVGHAALASKNDVNAAVKAAHAAFPAWSRTSYAERAAKLHEIADYLVSDQQDVDFRSRLFCREHGKIIFETLLEMSRLGRQVQINSRLCRQTGKRRN